VFGVGIIGTGVGIRTHAPGFAQAGNTQLSALFSPNHSKAKQLGERLGFQNVYPTYEEVCEDPSVDLVVVASPNAFHVEQATYALECGKHVLCEKPLAITNDGCRALVFAAKEHPTQWSGVNHQLRFSPYFQKMREIIRSGELGRPFQARILQQGNAAADPKTLWSWSFDGEAGGGVRWAMGSHLVDLAEFLMEEPPGVVFGSMHTVVRLRQRGEAVLPVNASSEFSGSILLTDGTQVIVSAIAAAQSGFRFDVDIFLERGEMHFDLTDKLRIYSELGRKVDQYQVLPGLKEGEVDNKVSFFAGTFRYYADAIVRDLSQPGSSSVQDAATFAEGARTVNTLEAFLESYRQGSSVRLQEMRDVRDSV
jgi:predicted dehydrogenase